MLETFGVDNETVRVAVEQKIGLWRVFEGRRRQCGRYWRIFIGVGKEYLSQPFNLCLVRSHTSVSLNIKPGPIIVTRRDRLHSDVDDHLPLCLSLHCSS